MNIRKRKAIFEIFQSVNPHPKTELNYSNHFELLTAVLLSAQATDKGVNIATKKLFQLANSATAMAELGEEGIANVIKTIGLYKTKAKNLHATSCILRDQFNDQVPNNRDALESLPGVGRKTANVVLNIAFQQPTMAVDTHIFRVSNRTRIAPGKNVLEVEQKLLRVIPKSFLLHAHHWLILHGRYVCKARKPACHACIIHHLCEYSHKESINHV